jgi:hypothetical protein
VHTAREYGMPSIIINIYKRKQRLTSEGHLPFEKTFGPEYSEFLTKDHLSEGYKRWVKKYGIVRPSLPLSPYIQIQLTTLSQNVWLSTTLLSSTWDDSKQLWTCTVLHNGSYQTLTASHLVFAMGAGGQEPKMPAYPGRVLRYLPILLRCC